MAVRLDYVNLECGNNSLFSVSDCCSRARLALGRMGGVMANTRAVQGAATLGKMVIAFPTRARQTASFMVMGTVNVCRGTVNVCRKTAKKAQDIRKSSCGKFLEGATKENIAEYVGWDVARKAGSLALGGIGREVGKNCGYGLGCGVTAISALFTAAYLSRSQLSFNLSSATKIAALVASTGVMAYVLPEMLGETGGQLGALGGEFTGDLIGGIIGGFAGMMLTNTEETFFSTDAPMKSYVGKSLQCILYNVVKDASGAPSATGISGWLIDQIPGILVYHALAIKDLAESCKKGRILNDLLPGDLDSSLLISSKDLSSRLTQLSINTGGTYLSDKVTKSVTNMSEVEVINVCVSEFLNRNRSALMTTLGGGFPELIQQHLVNSIGSLDANSLLSPLLSGIESGAKLSGDLLLKSMIKSFNGYKTFIKNNPFIALKQSEFNAVFSEWQKEKRPTEKARLQGQLQQVKGELCAVIREQLSLSASLIRIFIP